MASVSAGAGQGVVHVCRLCNSGAQTVCNIARLHMPDSPAHNHRVLFPVFGSAQALGGHRSNSSDHSRRLKLLTPEQKSAYLRQGSIMHMHGHPKCVLATRACYEMRRLTLLTISLYAYREGGSRWKIIAHAQTKVYQWLWSCQKASQAPAQPPKGIAILIQPSGRCSSSHARDHSYPRVTVQ